MPLSPLTQTFLDRATERFAFLVTSYGLAATTETCAGVWGAVRYSGPNLVVRVDYGDDRDHDLNVTVARPSPGETNPTRYALGDWLDGLGTRDRRMTGAAGLWTPESIDRVARDAAAVLQDVLPRILAAGPEIRRTMDERREADRRYRALPIEQRRTD